MLLAFITVTFCMVFVLAATRWTLILALLHRVVQKKLHKVNAPSFCNCLQ